MIEITFPFISTPILHVDAHLLLSARSMPVVLTESENENDSTNQNDIAKMMLQK